MNHKEKVLSYLWNETRNGPRYLKSKRIAEELGMSPKEVGAILWALSCQKLPIKVEKWSYSNSTTWKVEEVKAK
jgi:transcription initiation factor IIE alpha subunit